MGKSKYHLAALSIVLLNLGNLLSTLADDICDYYQNPPPPPEVKHSPPPPVAKSPPPQPEQQTCPIDALKLVACVDVLGGLIHIGIGSNAKEECCPLLGGLLDLDAALCLCTAIKVKLGNIVNLVVPVALEVLVGCGKHLPPGFQCPE
ncbi:36.4 kDa proline-rich protein-like [Melia azedarach]|uniref:36.4 kDa proline-rich protein-like n=1 Tax=Melia azedarach TaxID=155640 RepID=A0ACC1X2V0_MELAZ|nr:36.4 kDa proline-rich protein-like [Melia azedarach]